MAANPATAYLNADLWYRYCLLPAGHEFLYRTPALCSNASYSQANVNVTIVLSSKVSGLDFRLVLRHVFEAVDRSKGQNQDVPAATLGWSSTSDANLAKASRQTNNPLPPARLQTRFSRPSSCTEEAAAARRCGNRSSTGTSPSSSKARSTHRRSLFSTREDTAARALPPVPSAPGRTPQGWHGLRLRPEPAYPPPPWERRQQEQRWHERALARQGCPAAAVLRRQLWRWRR